MTLGWDLDMTGLEITLGALLVSTGGFFVGIYTKKQNKEYCDQIHKSCVDRFKEGREKFAKLEIKHEEVINNLAETNKQLAVTNNELKHLNGKT